MKNAFGPPGLAPNWSTGAKDAVGTAFGTESKVWFTIADGIITEVFYPTVDTADTKDLQFLVTDGRTFFDEERKDTVHVIDYIDPSALAFRVVNTAKNGRYRIAKSIVTDPGRNSLVMKVSFEPLKGEDLRLYVLFAPHIKNMGYGNTGFVTRYKGSTYLVACRADISSALAADVPFVKASVGYSGSSDGWQDIHDDYSMDWEFDTAANGNIALTAEIDTTGARDFTMCLSFGSSDTGAIMEAMTTLKRGYGLIEKEYIRGWKGYLSGLEDLGREGANGGRLYRISAMVLKAHEDKTHGGVIASLSIPWGAARGDGESGGYHLVWPRDLVGAAFAFMAAGDAGSAVRILKYLARTQRPDGSWPQNMWLDGTPYWTGVQLDEIAMPIMLAWRLRKTGALREDYYHMVRKAASFLLKEGPITEQERWEENSGFSPATLASEVSALICAAHWAMEEGEKREARYLFDTADYWASNIEEWTFSECDCIKDDPGHFLRIVTNPRDVLGPGEKVCHAEVFIKNMPAGAPHHQGEIVDGGFIELVRYGVRDPHDEYVRKSLKLVDRMLRKDFAYGPLFYRYNGDGYGEKEDGGPFDGSGVGRLWPLLAGERGMYEAMAGGDPMPYIRAMEGSANSSGMVPEQVWDGPDMPEKGLVRGRGTGAATPLMWAHAEYIKLLRTKRDGRGCDLIAEVYDRCSEKRPVVFRAAWKWNKQIRWVLRSYALRVVNYEPSVLIYSADDWKTKKEAALEDTGLGVYYTDFRANTFERGSTLRFSFYYPGEKRWEGRDYSINVV